MTVGSVSVWYARDGVFSLNGSAAEEVLGDPHRVGRAAARSVANGTDSIVRICVIASSTSALFPALSSSRKRSTTREVRVVGELLN